MKKQFNYLLTLVVCAMAAMFASCSPDDHSLASPSIAPEDLVEGIAFKVEHDAENPNIIRLTSLMPAEYTVAWNHPQGHTTATTHELRMPFAGEYEVKFGVNTRAGLVWSEPVTFTIDDMCEDFIKDEIWTLITGGIGQSKTWLLDIDASGKTYTKFASPIWFFNTGYTWDMLHNEDGDNYVDADPWDPSTAIDTNFPGEAWYWSADYAGNSWMCAAADYGTFTFDLQGGANIVTNNDFEGEKRGTFLIDTEKHTMKISGLQFYPIDSRIANCYDWNILYASEDYLQLLATTGDGSTSVCLNFMSQKYRDNWQAPVVLLPTGWFNIFSYQNIFASYKLDTEDAYDYFDLSDDRVRLNKGGSIDEELFSGYTLKFDCPQVDPVSNKGTYTMSLGENGSVSGAFTADSLGNVMLAKGLGDIEIAPVVKLQGSEMEMLRATIEDGKLTEFWLGTQLTDFAGNPYQYIGYHFVAKFGGAPEAETFKAYAHFFEIETWANDYYSDYVKCEDGKPVTITYEGVDMSAFNSLGLYVAVEKVLDKYPNCDVIINSISVDGTPVPIADQTLFGYTIEGKDKGDAPSVRRTILNAWGGDSNPIPFDSFKATSSLSVTFTVVFDSGEVHFTPAS